MFFVKGHAVASLDTIDEMQKIFRAYAERAKSEGGYVDVEFSGGGDNLKLEFSEQWTGQGAYEIHCALPESRAFFKRLQELAVETPKATTWTSTRVNL